MTELEQLRADNARLREMLDISTRTLERAHKRMRERALVHCGGCNECQGAGPPPLTDALADAFAPPTVLRKVMHLETGEPITLEILGTPNDRPLYACTQSGELLRIHDTISNGAQCANHGAVCVLVGYERFKAP